MAATKIILANQSTKEALQDWEELLLEIRTSTPLPIETPEQRAARRKRLEKPGNQEEWFQYYFPSKYKPAKFHIASTRRIMAVKRYRQSRAWARGLAKSSRRMREILYKMLVEKYTVYMLMISRSEENAIRLLAPFRAHLEANPRLIADYGIQKGRKWTEYEFITKSRNVFRAVGLGQNPRGAKLDETRSTILDFDDIDDDETVLNEDSLDKQYKWIEKNVIPTIDISEPYLIFCDNNFIAEDSLAVRFAKRSKDVEIMPVIKDDGTITWPEKNKPEDIEDIRTQMSDSAWQTEYLCNPINEGKTFPKMFWGKCPPLNRLQYAVAYADPATSNNDKPGGKSTKQNSCKAVSIVGYYEGKYYVYTCFDDHVNTDEFTGWLYSAHDYIVQRSSTPFVFIENNTLQDPFYGQVLKPAIHRKAKEQGRTVISINPDERAKPGKFFRIEATLQPLNKNGELVLNEAEKCNPHMERLEQQFKSVSPNSKTMDGPDSVEGAVWLIQNKIGLLANNGAQQYIKQFPRPINKKRF